MTARSPCGRPSTTCRTTGSSTSTGTSCPATSCRWSGCRRTSGGLVDVAIAICEDLWQDGGPVAVCRAAGAGLLVVPNASPYERGKDDTRLDLCPAPGPRGRSHAGLREHGGRPGRARVRRRLDHRGRRGRAARPGPAVRAGADRRRPGPARRQRLVPVPVRHAGRRARRLHDHHPAAGAARPARPARRGPQDRPDAARHLAAAARPRGGLRGPGPRRPGLRRQERVRLGDPRPVRRHRLRADRDDRGRRGRPGPGARGAHAQPLLVRPLGHRRRGPGQAPGPARPDGADPAHGRRVRGGARPDRPGRGEPAGQDPRHDPDVAVQRRGPPGPHHGQQERAGHRLLHALRRLGRRVRADQGRAQDAGLGAGPVAQPGRRRAAARPRRSRRTRSPSRRAPSWRPARWTATRCRITGARRDARGLRGARHGRRRRWSRRATTPASSSG